MQSIPLTCPKLQVCLSTMNYSADLSLPGACADSSAVLLFWQWQWGYYKFKSKCVGGQPNIINKMLLKPALSHMWSEQHTVFHHDMQCLLIYWIELLDNFFFDVWIYSSLCIYFFLLLVRVLPWANINVKFVLIIPSESTNSTESCDPNIIRSLYQWTLTDRNRV